MLTYGKVIITPVWMETVMCNPAKDAFINRAVTNCLSRGSAIGMLLGTAALFASGGVSRAQGLTTLASFNGSDGANPYSGLTLSKGILYGTTGRGGANGDGAVFSLPVTGGTPNVLTSFGGANGEYPDASLTLSDGTLYGTTYQGGASGAGEVFSLPTSGGTPSVLASFNGDNGAGPYCGLVLSGNTLYGTTQAGGATYGTGINGGLGEVFSFSLADHTLSIMASFDGADGAGPTTGLTLSGNTLYGTTAAGGANRDGEIFSLPVTGGAPAVLASFSAADGISPGPSPTFGLILAGNTLYGTTKLNAAGTIFSLSLTNDTITGLTKFNGANGQTPLANLALSGNTLYGITKSGGANGDGEVFSLPITGGTPTILASFNGNNGDAPWGGLILSGSTLYGTTALGGAYGDGTVFSLPIPEPASLALLAVGGVPLLVRQRRRNKVENTVP